MQNIQCKRFLTMCATAFFYASGCQAQQMGLDYEAGKIVAGVVVAGMAYRTAVYGVVFKALSPINVSEELYVGSYAMETAYPSNKKLVLDFINDRGFTSALLAGVCTAAAARSGSLQQLSMKDVIKPAAWGFGTLLALHIPFWSRIVWCRLQDAKMQKEFVERPISATENAKKEQIEWANKGDVAVCWERFVIGYAHKAVVVGLPFYVLYQRYNNQG